MQNFSDFFSKSSEALFFDVEVFYDSLYKYGFHDWVLKGIAELKESNFIQSLLKKPNISAKIKNIIAMSLGIDRLDIRVLIKLFLYKVTQIFF